MATLFSIYRNCVSEYDKMPMLFCSLSYQAHFSLDVLEFCFCSLHTSKIATLTSLSAIVKPLSMSILRRSHTHEYPDTENTLNVCHALSRNDV